MLRQINVPARQQSRTNGAHSSTLRPPAHSYAAEDIGSEGGRVSDPGSLPVRIT